MPAPPDVTVTAGAGTTLHTLPAVGQSTMANSLPVTIASDQGTIPVSNATLPLPAGAATSALQTTINTTLGTPAQDGTDATGIIQLTGGIGIRGWLSSIFSRLGTPAQDGTDATGVTQLTGGVGARGWLSGIFSKLSNAIAVSQSGTWTVQASAGTNLNTSSLALDASVTAPFTPITPGSASATKGILLGGQYNSTLPAFTNGQQGLVPIDQSGAINAGFDGFQVTPASVTSAATIFTQDMTGYAGISVQVISAGTSCTITYETSDDNTTWFLSGGFGSAHTFTSTTSATSTAAALNTYPKRGRYFRARVSTYGSGTVSVIYSLHKSFPVFSTGEVGAAGISASGTTISTAPLYVGFDARTSNLAVTNGQGVYGIATLAGVQIVYPWSIPEATWQHAAVSGGIVNSTTAEQLVAAAGAGIRNYCTRLQVSTNNSTFTATEIVVRDGASGTVIWRGNIPASTAATPTSMMSINFEPPLRGSAATLMEFATLTATGTGTAVYVNAQGYQGP